MNRLIFRNYIKERNVYRKQIKFVKDLLIYSVAFVSEMAKKLHNYVVHGSKARNVFISLEISLRNLIQTQCKSVFRMNEN